MMKSPIGYHREGWAGTSSELQDMSSGSAIDISEVSSLETFCKILTLFADYLILGYVRGRCKCHKCVIIFVF